VTHRWLFNARALLLLLLLPFPLLPPLPLPLSLLLPSAPLAGSALRLLSATVASAASPACRSHEGPSNSCDWPTDSASSNSHSLSQMA